MNDDDEAREHFKTAWLEVARRMLDPNDVAWWQFGVYQPVRVDAGGWGFLEVRRIDPGPEAAADIERHEARERHLDDIENGGPLWRWEAG
jgi:hypothetical protein